MTYAIGEAETAHGSGAAPRIPAATFVLQNLKHISVIYALKLVPNSHMCTAETP